jgi:hypothetical protein
MVVSLRTLRHSLKAPQLTPLQTSSILPFFALFLDFLHAWRWADVGQSVGGVDGSHWRHIWIVSTHGMGCLLRVSFSSFKWDPAGIRCVLWVVHLHTR